jgi:hypothetical protein
MDIKNRITEEVYFVTDTVVDWVDIFTRQITDISLLNLCSIAKKKKD